MTAWATPIVWSPITPLSPANLQQISNNLNHLKELGDSIQVTINNLAPAPVQRPASLVSGTTWTIARAYGSGKIQVFLNGIIRKIGSDWQETSPSGGTVTFTFQTNATDRVDILDWTT